MTIGCWMRARSRGPILSLQEIFGTFQRNSVVYASSRARFSVRPWTLTESILVPRQAKFQNCCQAQGESRLGGMPDLATIFRAQSTGRSMSGPRKRPASILHGGYDAFFVSVELLDRPELRGKAGGRRGPPQPARRGFRSRATRSEIRDSFCDALTHRWKTLARHAVFLERASRKNMESGATASRRSSGEISPSSKWFRSTKPTSISPAPNACRGPR